jgi:hypothetical protein
MTYKIDLYITHRDANNDDCITGDEATSLEVALAVLDRLKSLRNVAPYWSHAVITDPDGNLVHEERNPNQRHEPDDDDLDRAEAAQLASMTHGIDAFNKSMGNETTPIRRF